jgi:hypothetical protein
MSASIQWAGAEVPTLHLSYTAAVGISPQAAILVCAPQDLPPAQYGDLTFSDGTLSVTLRDCLLDGIRETFSGAGRVWEMQIADRRWMWELGPAVSGRYNQTDKHNKLIPWTVRSPYQLAVLCLDALGETNYSIDLPGGLAYPDVTDDVPPLGPGDVAVDPKLEYLNLGENLPPTSTAPPTAWDGTPAAQALANLVQQFGRVVVFDPITDAVSIQVEGEGTGLPDGAILTRSPALDPKGVPASVEVQGAPTRYQVRLKLRSVGKEWDGSYRPWGELSYAPARDPQKMKVRFQTTFGAGTTYALTLNGVTFTSAGGPNGSAISSDLANQINLSTAPQVAGKVTASVDFSKGSNEGELVLTGVKDGYEFTIDVGGNTSFKPVCIDGPIPPGKGFEECLPPNFPTVVPTDRLNYFQAMQLAQESIFRLYQVVTVDPSDDTKTEITVPSGDANTPDFTVTNRYRLVVQGSRPEQTEPRAPDVDRIDPATNQPYAAEFYNGYSQDRPPATFGSIHFTFRTHGIWADQSDMVMENTPRGSQFYVPCRLLDAERQVFEFAEPVWRMLGGGADSSGKLGRRTIQPTDAVIEVGVVLLEEFLNNPLRYNLVYPVPGGLGPSLTVVREDVQQEVIGEYGTGHVLTGSHVFDWDADFRATYYAQAVANKFRLTGALINKYAGLLAVSLSGVVRQVQWELSEGGFATVGSANTEFSTVIPPYPTRRMRENLPPDALQALLNVRSRTYGTRTALGALAGATAGF